MRPKHHNIVHLFLSAANQYPNNIAIIDGRVSISYVDLKKEVKQTAAYFRGQGIEPGDRVLVFIPMGIDLYRIVLALFYIGAVAVFLDEWVSKDRLLLCCRIADCKGFIGTIKARVLGYFAKEIRNIPIKLSLRKRGIAKVGVQEVALEASALITFTTGSTGLPKAADRSHDFLAAQFSILKDKINPHPQDVDMPVLPIVLFLNLGIGCTSVIAKFNSKKPSSLNPDKIINQIKCHQINRITASPFFVKTIAKYLCNRKLVLNNLKQIFTGGAPVFPNEADLYNTAFPDTDIQIVYGSTESEPISTISSKEIVLDPYLKSNGLPVGQVHPKTSLKVIKITTENIHMCNNMADLEVGTEKIGEIIVAGDHVLKKYFNNPSAFETNKIISDKVIWHRTGDSGFIKDDQLFLTGRCKQLIDHKGKVFSPFIIENKLQLIDGVSMGTIIRQNEEVVLVVETNLSVKDIESHVVNIFYDRLEVVKKIPRDPRHFSKIDYAELSKILN